MNQELEFSKVLQDEIGSFDSELFEDYETKILRMQGLLELTGLVTATLQESRLQKIILYSCQGQFLGRSATLFLITDTERKIYEDVLSTGLKEERFDLKLEQQAEIIKLFTQEDNGIPLMQKKPYLYVQIKRLLKYASPFDMFQPEIILPLWGRTSFYGFILLGARIDGHTYSGEEMTTMGQFGDLVAMAIENARLFDMAVLDKMTGLFNHHFFKSMLYQEMEKARKKQKHLCLIMCDLDYFKSVNDTYGHQIGDFVLTTFSRLLKKHLKSKFLAARYGGEEFAIVLPDTDIQEAMRIAENIRKGFEKLQFKSVKGDFKKTTSMGLATLPFDKDISLAEFIEHADQALYYSKNNGRNQITIYREGLR